MGNDSARSTLAAARFTAAARALRARLSLRRGLAAVASDLALAAATLLLLFGLFMGWQTWLVASQASATQALVHARTAAAQKIGSLITTRRAEVARALAQPRLIAQLAAADDAATRAAVAQEIKAEVHGAAAVTLYSAQLNEVLHGNLQRLGYARAAQLVDVLSQARLGPAQSPKAHVFSFAGPMLGADGTILAYATVDFRDAALRAALHGAPFSGGRLELRQSGKTGDIVLDSAGNEAVTGPVQASSTIPYSLFRVSSAPPQYWLPVTGSLASALILALVTFFAGVALLWWRPRLRARLGGSPAVDEPVLADLVAAAPATAQAEPAAKPTSASPTPVAKPEEQLPERGIFRADGIRGVAGKTLDAGVARQIGRAIGSALQDKDLHEIVVGRDGRQSGPELSGALIDGLRAAGADVIDVDAVPTPVCRFAAFQLNAGSCVWVTGGDDPPDCNGFDIVLGGEPLADAGIADLYTRIAERHLAEGEGALRQYDIAPEYIERIASDIQVGRPLKVVVDCGNGIAAITGPGVIHAIGCDAVPLYAEVDGTFPNHPADPSQAHNLADLILTVQKTGADLGLAFDGDGGSLGVVTRDGEIICPDRVLMLFAQDVLLRNPGATILYDVACTGHLQPLILKAGGSPLLWKTGRAPMQAKLHETGAQLAGSLGGRFFFRERWYGFDDGVYAAARLLEILADDPEGRTPEEIFAAVPKDVATPELQLPMADGQGHPFVTRFRERAQFDGARITTLDGIRADWPDGFGVVRAPDTASGLALRFAADNDAALQRIKDAFRAQLLACDDSLQLPF